MLTRTMLSIQATPDVSAIRTAQLFNEEQTIIPCVALVEGVLWPANAPSPELALAEEFGRFPNGWNGRPVVFDHPKVNGEAVSASDPQIMEEVAFGQIFNTRVEKGKLKVEIWINEDRVKNMSQDVQDTVKRLKEGDETVEVSTGLYTMTETTSGEFNGETFEGIWRNIVPDHLAVLPEGVVGACSVADGCGAPRTNKLKPVMRAARMNNEMTTTPTILISTENNAHTCGCKTETCECVHDEKKGIFQKIMEAAGDFLQIRGNSETLSDQDTRTALAGALSKQQDFFWISAVFEHGDGSGVVVFEDFMSGKLFEQGYNISTEGTITLDEEKREVRPVTQFVAVNAVSDAAVDDAEVVNETQDGSIQENSMKMKDQLVNDLVANKATSFTEDDRAWLSTLEESQLVKLSPVINDVADAEEELPVAAVTTEDYIASAPADIQEVLNEGVRMHSQRKQSLVKGIMANARNRFSEDQLKVKSLTELESIASLATDISYEGLGRVRALASADDNAVPAPIPLFDLNKRASA